MKRIILLGLFSLCLGASLAPSVKQVAFRWSLNPADLGGLSTNDYYTNIVFNLLSVTNCAIPTNQWPVVAMWPASAFPSPDGTHWTNSLTIDGLTRFYIIQAVNLNGGSGPFSSVAVWVPSPPQGFVQVFGP